MGNGLNKAVEQMSVRGGEEVNLTGRKTFSGKKLGCRIGIAHRSCEYTLVIQGNLGSDP